MFPWNLKYHFFWCEVLFQILIDLDINLIANICPQKELALRQELGFGCRTKIHRITRTFLMWITCGNEVTCKTLTAIQISSWRVSFIRVLQNEKASEYLKYSVWKVSKYEPEKNLDTFHAMIRMLVFTNYLLQWFNF